SVPGTTAKTLRLNVVRSILCDAAVTAASCSVLEVLLVQSDGDRGSPLVRQNLTGSNGKAVNRVATCSSVLECPRPFFLALCDNMGSVMNRRPAG
ncbi:hypothetical protein FRX31_017378, partial [Thalictrum thalictroides]